MYLYWHSATFFLPVCVAIGYFLIEKFYGLKGDYKNLGMALGGTLLAIGSTFLISSGFFAYMNDIIFGTFTDTIIGKKVSIAEGGELYPVDIFNVIQNNTFIFIAFVTALSIDIFSYISYRVGRSTFAEYLSGVTAKRRYLQTCVLILTALFFLGTVAVSGRFGDYFTMFAALYIALSFDYARRNLIITGTPLIRYGLATGLSIVLIYLFSTNLIFLQQRIAHGAQETEFYQIGLWLKNNTPPESVVLNVNWSWFPHRYYHSPRNNYIWGLEPRFAYDYNPSLYWLAYNSSHNGYVCDQEKCPVEQERLMSILENKKGDIEGYAKSEGDKIADVYRSKLDIKYIVTHSSYALFDYLLDHNTNFEKKIYNAEYGYSVYGVKDVKSK